LPAGNSMTFPYTYFRFFCTSPSLGLYCEIILGCRLFAYAVCDRVMAQAVCYRPLIAEARLLAWVAPCGGQSGTRVSISPSSSNFPVNIILS
jgi:hypothetical protein